MPPQMGGNLPAQYLSGYMGQHQQQQLFQQQQHHQQQQQQHLERPGMVPFTSSNTSFSMPHSSHSSAPVIPITPSTMQAPTLTRTSETIAPPASGPFHTVLPDDDTTSMVNTQRRNTTTGHNLASNISLNSQFSAPFVASSSDSYQNKLMPLPGRPDQAAPHLSSNNSKFLQFLEAEQEVSILDARKRQISIGLKGHLSGQFSLSPTGPSSSHNAASNDLDTEMNESPMKKSPISPRSGSTKEQSFSKSPPTNPESPQPQLELTFYRRNLFQVSCTVTNARNAIYACNSKSDSSSPSRIIGLSMEVSLSGTDESKTPKLLYTPLKTDVKKQKQEPAVKPLWPKDSNHSEAVDWKRLRFKSATLHNGRRRLQNYFTLTVAVIAELENRKRVRLVSAKSRPIVVRGRNPRFYSNRQTIAISDVNSDSSFLAPQTLMDHYNEMNQANLADDDNIGSDDEEVDEDPSKPSTKKIKIEEEEDDDGDDGDQDEEENDENDCYQYYPMPSTYYDGPVEVVYRPHASNHVPAVLPGLESSIKRPFASMA